jgi:hypothetical protein
MLSGIAISVYWFVLYQYFPQYMFDLRYFFLPLLASVGANVAMLKLSKAPNAKVSKKKEVAAENTQKLETGVEQTVNQVDLKEEPVAREPETLAQPAVNTVDIEQIIEQKIGTVTAEMNSIKEELTASKNEMNNVRNDMGTLKTGLKELSTTFETTLTDLKAFQAEIANPLNFMRKYVESIDIKNLSDPTLPLANLPQTGQAHDATSHKVSDAQPLAEVKQFTKTVEVEQKEETARPSAVSQPAHMPSTAGNETEPASEAAFRQIFSGSLTIGRLMAVISLIGEILQKSGPDSVSLLVEQCKLMGLKADDEQMIYNIVNMLNKSGVPVNDMLIMVYRFAKIMGITDKEADIHYAKLMANKSSGVSIPASTELMPRNRD